MQRYQGLLHTCFHIGLRRVAAQDVPLLTCIRSAMRADCINAFSVEVMKSPHETYPSPNFSNFAMPPFHIPLPAFQLLPSTDITVTVPGGSKGCLN